MARLSQAISNRGGSHSNIHCIATANAQISAELIGARFGRPRGLPD